MLGIGLRRGLVPGCCRRGPGESCRAPGGLGQGSRAGFPSEIRSGAGLLARALPEALDYPFPCSFGRPWCSAWSRDELRNLQLAGFGNQLGNAPGRLCVPPQRLAPGSRARAALQVQEVLQGRAVPPQELGACLELCCSSHTCPTPGAPAGRASVRGSRIPLEAEAQGPVPLRSQVCPELGLQSGAHLPLSSVRTKARAVRGGGGKSLPISESGWGGPRRPLSAGLAPSSVPLHVAVSTSAGPGALPRLAAALLPPSCSRALGSAGLGGSALGPAHRAQRAPRFGPSRGGAGQAVVLTGTGQQRGGFSQRKHKVSLCLSCFFGCFLGSLPGSSSGLKRLLL